DGQPNAAPRPSQPGCWRDRSTLAERPTSRPSPHTVDHVRNAVAKLRPQVLGPECPPDPHALCRGVVAKGHQMGAHFTNHSPQLGVLVQLGIIVDADQGVVDGLRHDWVRPPRLGRAAWAPAPPALRAELEWEWEWELEVQGSPGGLAKND